jgi:hypothetical protein
MILRESGETGERKRQNERSGAATVEKSHLLNISHLAGIGSHKAKTTCHPERSVAKSKDLRFPALPEPAVMLASGGHGCVSLSTQ